MGIVWRALVVISSAGSVTVSSGSESHFLNRIAKVRNAQHHAGVSARRSSQGCRGIAVESDGKSGIRPSVQRQVSGDLAGCAPIKPGLARRQRVLTLESVEHP